jgi:alpha-glucoside transport system permease protein
MEQLALALAAVLAAPAAAVAYIVLAEQLLGLLPAPRRGAARPWLWLAPAGAFLLALLVYPMLETIALSFRSADASQAVGLANYQHLVTDPNVRLALRNNLIWLCVFPAVTVALGLLIAVLTDQVRYETAAKAAVFLPMAISFVAASVIWKFMYDFRPPSVPQTGVLNALLMAVAPGAGPQAWLINRPWNNLALIAVAVWTWTGFATVILSAGLKGIPTDLLEAARVDGASGLQTFRYITLPLLAPTIAVVATTLVIFALKAFDIVYVLTNGNYDTEVVANRMYKELFNVRHFGRASALAVLLLAATIPVMLLNIRHFRNQEERR